MIVCEFENGGKGNLRHVTVGAIAINNKQEVLLIKRASSHRFGTYTIPGGFLDRDENTEKATLRELKEETGYNGEIVNLFRVNDNPKRPKEDRQNVDFLYIVKITSGKPMLNKEVSEVGWFDETSLPSEEEFAFDHRDSILRYFDHLEQPISLPILG